MAVDALNSTTATTSALNNNAKNKTSLSTDDFMTLLLAELKYQDPTKPTDTEQILTQTSQLASLESTDKTNSTLADLTKSLASSQQFSTISAIGKMADIGSDAITSKKGDSATFELYFPEDVDSGTINIKDTNGAVVQTIDLGNQDKGVDQFTWDGTTHSGKDAEDGIYHIDANYTDINGDDKTTSLGKYPIASVKFEDGKSLLKLGSSYIPMENIKEIY